jgi:hypothetical protein
MNKEYGMMKWKRIQNNEQGISNDEGKEEYRIMNNKL